LNAAPLIPALFLTSPRDGLAVHTKGNTIMSAQTAPASKKPTHRLYRVSGEGKDAIWTPIGAAWANQDGKGFSVNVDALPITGRIVMRLITPKAEQPALI
jgi:hypothetical protein